MNKCHGYFHKKTLNFSYCSKSNQRIDGRIVRFHEHNCIFRCILELGSGLGLTGLVISMTCQPKKYIFSDCHEQVLQKLAANIVLNFTSCDHSTNRKCSDAELNADTLCNSVYSQQDSYLFRQCDICRKGSEMLFSSTYLEICEKYWSPIKRSCQTKYNLHNMQLNINKNIQLSQIDWEQFNKEDILAIFNDVDTIVVAGKFITDTLLAFFILIRC